MEMGGHSYGMEGWGGAWGGGSGMVGVYLWRLSEVECDLSPPTPTAKGSTHTDQSRICWVRLLCLCVCVCV